MYSMNTLFRIHSLQEWSFSHTQTQQNRIILSPNTHNHSIVSLHIRFSRKNPSSNEKQLIRIYHGKTWILSISPKDFHKDHQFIVFFTQSIAPSDSTLCDRSSSTVPFKSYSVPTPFSSNKQKWEFPPNTRPKQMNWETSTCELCATSPLRDERLLRTAFWMRREN